MTLPPGGRTQIPLTNNAQDIFKSVIVAVLQYSGFSACQRFQRPQTLHSATTPGSRRNKRASPLVIR